MLREERMEAGTLGSNGPKKKEMSKAKKRMLAFARKNRTHWRTRMGYFLANGIFLALVYTTNGTSLWREDGKTLNMEHLVTQALFVVFSWIAYLLVQGSDPGYVSEEVSPDEAVEYSTEAMRGGMYDDDEFLNEGMDDILSAKRHFEELDQAAKKNEEDESENGTSVPTAAGDVQLTVSDEFPTELGDYDESELDSLMPRLDTKHPKYPYRTIYCRQTRRWVATYDHYCGVLSTPIGEKNHARFWLFLQMQTIAVCWGIGIVHSGFRWAFGEQSWWGLNLHAFITVLFLYIVLLFVGGLYLFHSFLACTCLTTYEFMRSDRIDYLKGTRDFDLPYSRGLGGNLKFFIFKDGLLHILFNRKWTPEPWKLPGKIVRDSEEWWENLWENKYWSCC